MIDSRFGQAASPVFSSLSFRQGPGLGLLRQQIEEGFDNLAEVDDEVRGIVARN